MKRALVFLVLGLAGCYDSIVSDPCASGYHLDGDHCVANSGNDGGPGGMDPIGPVGPGSGGPSKVPPLVCDAPLSACDGMCVDLSSDPLNCGHCGRVCPSGICSQSMCVGDVAGHIIAIGHDYASSDPAMERVFGNALALSTSANVRIGWWRGDASQVSADGARNAAHKGLQQLGRNGNDVPLTQIDGASLAEIDALVIEAQTGDANAAHATGASAKSALASFLSNGHVVIVLEGDAGVGYALAAGAGLYTVGPPVDVTNLHATVANAADAVALQVASPYLAKTSSVCFANAAGIVITAPSGVAIVFHQTY
jgi:hypothetical protein